METYEKKIQEIYNRWLSVQGDLKAAEQISQLSVLPAINELRYAGRIFVVALAIEMGIEIKVSDKDEELADRTISETLAIVSQYITNAEHDISDSLLYFFQKRVDEVNLRYGAASIINKYGKGYEQLMQELAKARRLVVDSRKSLKEREKNYREIKNILNNVKKLYFNLDKAEVFMAIEVERYRRRIHVLLSTVILLSAILMGGAAYLVWDSMRLPLPL